MSACFQMDPCVRVTIGDPEEKNPPYTMIDAIQKFMQWCIDEKVYPMRGATTCGWFYCAEFRSADQFRVRNFLKTLLPEVQDAMRT